MLMNDSINKLKANKLISTLNAGNFYCECPCECGKEINLKNTNLFYDNELTTEAKIWKKQQQDNIQDYLLYLKTKKANMTAKAQSTTMSINKGLILERIAPSFKTFPFNHKDCRSLFNPIDYIIFEGLSKSKLISKIIFTDIKTGAAPLQKTQQEIKSLVKNKKVEFETY